MLNDSPMGGEVCTDLAVAGGQARRGLGLLDAQSLTSSSGSAGTR